MNPLRVLLPSHIEWSQTQRTLAVCAVIVAIALLVLYVDLLHVWMARGDQMREAQRSFVLKPSVKTAAMRTPLGLANPRKLPAAGVGHDE